MLVITIPRCEPCCWTICVQNWVIFGNVGKYSVHGASGIQNWDIHYIDCIDCIDDVDNIGYTDSIYYVGYID